MKRLHLSILAVSLAGAWLPLSVPAEAAEMVSAIKVIPGRYIDVSGDVEKFEAHRWMNGGYAGGLERFESVVTYDNGTRFTAEARAIGGNNDYGTKLLLENADIGLLRFDFTEFRKYYDGTGGVYYPFSVYSSGELDRKLFLDIGNIELEAALTLPDVPDLRLKYAREYKDGVKSRLTWAQAREVIAAGNTIRKILPSPQEIDEVVDVFSVEAEHTLGKITLIGEQRWEFTRSETKRFEVDRATTGSAADGKIREHELRPESAMITSIVGAKGNFLEEKLFTGTAYRYARMNAQEFETTIERNAAGIPTTFSNPKVSTDARADTRFESHTWAQNMAYKVAPDLSFTGKLQGQLIARKSSSTRPQDYTPNAAGGAAPDGVIDRIDLSLSDDHARVLKEGIGVRYSGIPLTALYSNLDLEQSRSRLRENKTRILGAASGFTRDTVTRTDSGEITLGARFFPVRILDITTEYSKERKKYDYDHQIAPGGGSASAWFDSQEADTDALKARITLKPARWFRTSLRYKLQNQTLHTRFASSNDTVKTGTDSHALTYDVSVQPMNTLFTHVSFTRQTSVTYTPAKHGPTGPNPDFKADVNTFLASVDFIPIPETRFNGSFEYSKADNFNDFTAIGLPLGVDNAWMSFMLGIEQQVGERTTLGFDYEFHKYQANSLAEVGNYRANVVWFTVERLF